MNPPSGMMTYRERESERERERARESERERERERERARERERKSQRERESERERECERESESERERECERERESARERERASERERDVHFRLPQCGQGAVPLHAGLVHAVRGRPADRGADNQRPERVAFSRIHAETETGLRITVRRTKSL